MDSHTSDILQDVLSAHTCTFWLLPEDEELLILWVSLKDSVTLAFLMLWGVTLKGTHSYFFSSPSQLKVPVQGFQ